MLLINGNREREHGDNQGWVLITLDGIQIVYTKTDLLLLRVFRGPWLQYITAPFMPTVSPSRSSPPVGATPGSVPLDLNLPEIFGRLDSQVAVKCSLQPFVVPVTVFFALLYLISSQSGYSGLRFNSPQAFTQNKTR